MDKLDQMIAEALAEEDRDIVARTAEQGFFTQFFGQLSGRNAWVGWLTTAAIFAYAALMFWAGWKFFTVSEELAALRWGLVTLFSGVVIGMLKLYLFQEMQTNRVIRELKRVELLLAKREG